MIVLVAGAGAAFYFMNRDSDDSNDTSSVAASSEGAQVKTNKPDNSIVVEPKSLPEGYPENEAPIYQQSTITAATTMG